MPQGHTIPEEVVYTKFHTVKMESFRLIHLQLKYYIWKWYYVFSYCFYLCFWWIFFDNFLLQFAHLLGPFITFLLCRISLGNLSTLFHLYGINMHKLRKRRLRLWIRISQYNTAKSFKYPIHTNRLSINNLPFESCNSENLLQLHEDDMLLRIQFHRQFHIQLDLL